MLNQTARLHAVRCDVLLCGCDDDDEKHRSQSVTRTTCHFTTIQCFVQQAAMPVVSISRIKASDDDKE